MLDISGQRSPGGSSKIGSRECPRHRELNIKSVTNQLVESMAGHILVIDDDAELCKLVGRFLNAEGFRVEAVRTSGQGVERALSGEHELIVLDVMLPGMDGYVRSAVGSPSTKRSPLGRRAVATATSPTPTRPLFRSSGQKRAGASSAMERAPG